MEDRGRRRRGWNESGGWGRRRRGWEQGGDADFEQVDMLEMVSSTGSQVIDKIEWDGSGERLAVSFEGGDDDYQGLLAIYDTSNGHINSASLIGFIRGPGKYPKPISFAFDNKYKQGSLLSVVFRFRPQCFISFNCQIMGCPDFYTASRAHRITTTDQHADAEAYPKTDGSLFILITFRVKLGGTTLSPSKYITSLHSESTCGGSFRKHIAASLMQNHPTIARSNTAPLPLSYPCQVMPVPWSANKYEKNALKKTNFSPGMHIRLYKLPANLCLWMHISFLEQFKATNLHSEYFLHIFRDAAVCE
ncbi:hypothetical protein ACFE04_030929 [Oxalis oulophora]